jgi:hypothetical protein
MVKVKHYVDKNSGEITREVKNGNKVTYETITQKQLDNYEAGSGLFGCIGSIIGFFIFMWILTNIFGSSM